MEGEGTEENHNEQTRGATWSKMCRTIGEGHKMVDGGEGQELIETKNKDKQNETSH